MTFKDRNIYKVSLITINAFLLLLIPLFLINLLRIGKIEISSSLTTWHFIWRPYFIDGKILFNKWIYSQQHIADSTKSNFLFWYPVNKTISGYMNGLSVISSYKIEPEEDLNEDICFEEIVKNYNRDLNKINSIDNLDEKEFLKRFELNIKNRNDGSDSFFIGKKNS